MKKEKPKGDPNKVLPGWMASYADMFTVMMVFFILLFAMSVIDEELFEAFLLSYNPARTDLMLVQGLPIDGGVGVLPDAPMPVPTPPPADPGEGGAGETAGEYIPALTDGDTIAEMANSFRTYMAQYDMAPDDHPGFPIEITEGETYVLISFPASDGLFFNSGSAVLLSPAVTALDALGGMLREYSQRGHGIIVEGHTDNVPMQSAMFPSNRHLSGSRAAAVVEHLIGNWGLDPRAIFSIGMGEYFPIDTNDTVEGRANNRRVDIKVFSAEASGGAVGSWFVIPMD